MSDSGRSQSKPMLFLEAVSKLLGWGLESGTIRGI